MVLGSLAGVISAGMLFSDQFHGFVVVCVLLMFISYSLCVPELVVDATVAENIKRYPNFSTQLQVRGLRLP